MNQTTPTITVQLKDAKDEIFSLKKDIDQLNFELESSRAKEKELNGQLKSSRDAFEVASAKIEELEKQSTKLQDEIKSAQTKFESEVERVGALKAAEILASQGVDPVSMTPRTPTMTQETINNLHGLEKTKAAFEKQRAAKKGN